MRLKRRAPDGERAIRDRAAPCGQAPGRAPAGPRTNRRGARADRPRRGRDGASARKRPRACGSRGEVAGLRCQPAADRRRRHERRRELAGLLRQDERAFGITLHRFLGHRRLDHRAPAVRGRLVDEPRAGVRVDGRERAGPVSASRAIVEDRLTGPGRGRARMGAHRILQRRRMIAGAPRLDMQAAQANAMRFVMVEHRIVGRDGPRPVARRAARIGLAGAWPSARARSAGSRRTRAWRRPRASPAPTASMPRDKAWKPFSRLRACAPTETSEGMRKTKRSRPQTIAIAIASARTAPSANSNETSYCSPRQVTSTTPGLFASQVRPPATSASAARKISRRTIMTPLQNAKRAPRRRLAARPPRPHGFGPPASRPIAASRID